MTTNEIDADAISEQVTDEMVDAACDAYYAFTDGRFRPWRKGMALAIVAALRAQAEELLDAPEDPS